MQPDRGEISSAKLRRGGAEERLRLLAERETDTAILTLDPRGYVLACNAEAQRLLHCREHDLRGEHFHRLFFRPEAVRRGEPERELYMARTQGHAAVTRWYARPDGTALWAAGLTAALTDPDGLLLGFVTLLQDRTAEKLLEWGPPGLRGAKLPDPRSRLGDLLTALEGCVQRSPGRCATEVSSIEPAAQAGQPREGAFPGPVPLRPQTGVHGEATP